MIYRTLRSPPNCPDPAYYFTKKPSPPFLVPIRTFPFINSLVLPEENNTSVSRFEILKLFIKRKRIVYRNTWLGN